ncbi:inorganic phosphate transporter [Thermomonas sp.]|uniref:inorganic phosphate transporter n=1 Tax=Thermomonas sp. TaxID=1971895 RepID=UPI001DA91E03|nr:inorganic phosphate transporter [Thermomonas sp.]MBZ0087835.1 inorganic phosphate transporter [Thermomonas sp.]MCO5054344.1 inorganic phosphate transporter [Thermomonas sp.]HRO63774.1 inorganic phosphate transporter [Thermomonas sp.]
MLTLVLVVIAAALIFEFINGFHDTANSIAASVATKVLSPGQAVVMAAVMNMIGALTGTAVAATIATGIVNTAVVDATSQLMLCALLGAIAWNLVTWWFGLPSSSSHALIGGLCGAALSASHMDWNALLWAERAASWTQSKGLVWKVLVPMVTSPLAGFLLGFTLMVVLWALIFGMERSGGWLRRIARPRWINAGFGKLQIMSAAYMGYAHGHNDAQKTMGVIALTLIGAQASGALDDLPGWLAFMHPEQSSGATVADWIIVTCALVMAAGTASGGWRIIKTLGHKMVKLHPLDGFAVDTSSATVLMAAAHFGMPVSTTHTVSTAIMGVGFAKNPRRLKLGTIERIVWAWILTIPASATVAWLFYRGLMLVGWV